MRKYILIILLIIVCVLCFGLMIFGFKVGNFKINSYSEIELASDERKKLLAELGNKITNEFEVKNKNLTAIAQEYKTKKAEYDKLVAEGQITDKSIYNSIELYNMDYLWTKIGNYATEKEVTLQLDVTKSTSATSISSEYVMCDLSFTVTGEYIAITDFIYSIEDDDSLNFEISDFSMEKGGENLQATFVVKGVPVNSKTLSSIPTSAQAEYEEVLSSTNSSN